MTEQEMDLRAKYRERVEDKAAEYHLAAILAQLRPSEPSFVAAIDAATLTYLGRRLRVIATADCNEGSEPQRDKRRARLAADVRTIASWYGLTAQTDCDPRGCGLELHAPEGSRLPRNSLGDGFCVG